MELTKEHVEILRHTRDRTANGLYCGDSPAMQELVALKLMAPAGRKSFVPDPYFRMTVLGSMALADHEADPEVRWVKARDQFLAATKAIDDDFTRKPPPPQPTPWLAKMREARRLMLSQLN